MDFSSNNPRKALNYKSFDSANYVFSNNLYATSHESIRVSNLSDNTDPSRIYNVQDRIISLVKALEYISMKEN